MAPDAIPIQPVRSYAALTGEMIEVLFGEGYRLRGTEQVEVLQHGKLKVMADVVPGEAPALYLEAAGRSDLGKSNPGKEDLRLRGPKGFLPAPSPQPITAMLELPAGLMAAWNLSEGQRTTTAVGDVALRATVALGEAVCLRVDRSLVFAGGLDETGTARWIPDVVWADAGDASATPSEQPAPTKRLITENDVRRARMLRKRIRVQDGQIVTPAARTLAEELGVFEEE